MVKALPRSAAVVSVLAILAGHASPLAAAIPPPVVEPGPPPSGQVGPLEPTEQKAICGIPTGVLAHTDFSVQMAAEAMLDYTRAWQYTRGAGQKVAVIDTGVNRHPRLPSLEGGGDYVAHTDGLQDCDSHGTLVAGIIAGSPSPYDLFAGVAPEATILSIRQNSAVFSVAGAGGGQRNDVNAVSTGYGNTTTLAYAITRAVDLGATVINLSMAACTPASAKPDDAALGRAVRYAFERNVVVVAAAGNLNKQGGQGGLCSVQNSMTDPNRPLDNAWETVHTIASPAWFDSYVLTVGAVTPEALPADFSLRGPWVAVAAPGERITSLDSNGPGLINAEPDQQGALSPINGTSFAAPFVSGLAALIRAYRPDLNASQVMDVIKRTAHTPGSGPNMATGWGVIDPVAALTYELPPPDQLPNSQVGIQIPGRAAHGDRGRNARMIVYSVTTGSIVLMAIAYALASARRRKPAAEGRNRERADSPELDG
ncbi:subtilase family protein [Mycobacteroides abscessus subsp. bolletii]|uniref:type VII secretion-associated serine protease mycosin n=2 Tax=Mycobacteroides abscessus TaxID=36809 RepID=UPI0005A53832|nr:subtilase family protein [Mycobacteroides abscessus subsp. bolletii]SHR31055.1 subtilase family protein [Mycobacteroides abscessus subsp. abscessus]SHR55822.1 subtilase family protein [Mycobacteroides abscessus subsp. bolletii]SHS01525.1 subtilase family protein [Mycobacteroides abscessus subsp. bolletii]SHS35321.1 subtilase family protein [Mycobacteroides abscessus subsp. bolletii]